MTTVGNDEGRELPAAGYVGERVHRLMWRRKLSQREAAQSIGVSQSTLSKKIRGGVPITVDEVVALARLLDVEPGDLLPTHEGLVRHQGLEPRTRCYEVSAGQSHLTLILGGAA